MENNKENLLYQIERLLITIDGTEQAIQRFKDSPDICKHYIQFKSIKIKELEEVFNKYNSL